MEIANLANFLQALSEQNERGNGYQVHLNSGDLDTAESRAMNSHRIESVELNDLYFTRCILLHAQTILVFDNGNKKPVDHKEDGTPLYPREINSNMFIEIAKIEHIEDMKEFDDWFYLPTSRVFNLYMMPEDDNVNGHRNVVTIGFVE